MNFEDVDPVLRTLLFAGVLAGAVVQIWWVFKALAEGARQLATALLALVTLPAAVVAPFEGGPALTILGLSSIAAFAAAAALSVVPELRTSKTAAVTATASVLPAPQATPSPPATRVAGSAATAVLPQPPSDETVSLASPAETFPPAIGFLVEYSRDGRPHRLGFDTRIGREAVRGIRLESEGVSREHARVKFENGTFVLYDLGSTNGTRLVRAGRRRRLAAPAPLQDLDIVELGDAKLVFLTA